MLKMAIAKHSEQSRELRWLVEDFIFHAPFLGPFLNRIGAVRACQENAQRLLGDEALVAVFPEGIKGVSKLYKKRYQLQRFGRGGYVKLALRMGAPIIPAAVVGAEDAFPVLYRFSALAKSMGLPFLPVTPTFPLLGPLGLVPLPSRFVVLLGPPISGLDAYGPEAAEDRVIVNELNERVRGTVQALVDEARSLRGDHVYS
jgi:1-acyl-sn-glycerol-3-phosphate acyltransferase